MKLADMLPSNDPFYTAGANPLPADVVRLSPDGITTLMRGYAATPNGMPEMEKLLSLPFNRDGVNSAGESPLHAATDYGNAAMVEMLLPHFDAFKPNRSGFTPLHNAARAPEEKAGPMLKLILPRAKREHLEMRASRKNLTPYEMAKGHGLNKNARLIRECSEEMIEEMRQEIERALPPASPTPGLAARPGRGMRL